MFPGRRGWQSAGPADASKHTNVVDRRPRGRHPPPVSPVLSTGNDSAEARPRRLAAQAEPLLVALSVDNLSRVRYRAVVTRHDPSSFLPLKTDVFHILLAMSDQPRHGYGIIGEAESRSDGVVRLQTGALYRALRRLLRDGLIEVAGQPAGETSTDERRRYYRLTTLGRDVLQADVARMTRAVRVARRAGAGRGAG